MNISRATLPLLLAVFLLATTAALEAKMSDEAQLSYRREMVEFDLSLRTLASAGALNYNQTVLQMFERLSSYQTLRLPRYKKGMQAALAQLKKDGTLKYMSGVQAAAKTAWANFKGARSDEAKWKAFNQGVNQITYNCRACHRLTLN